MPMHDIHNYFDRITIINLRSRPERLQKFFNYLDKAKWPFRKVDVFEAIHGDTVGVHRNWKTGGGSYGCMLSHTRILERAIMDNIQRILVLEDDAYFPDPDCFANSVCRFLSEVPEDWDCLMLGGQSVRRESWQRGPQPHCDGIVRHDGCERTHAYALQGIAIKDLYRQWIHADCHIDWVMGPFLGKTYKVYSPVPFLIGQDAGRSDISGRNNGRQSWSSGDPKSPVVLLNSTRAYYETVKGQLLHGGYTLSSDGVDVGLVSIFTSKDSDEKKVRRLSEWVDMIVGEAASIGPNCLAAIWYPNIDINIVERTIGERIIVMSQPVD